MTDRAFDLTLDPVSAVNIATLLREFDTQDFDPTGEKYSGDEAHLTDEKIIDDLSPSPASPIDEELRAAVNLLNIDAQRDLLTLIWVGRGDFGAEDWARARHQAREVADLHAAQYLTETPLASDYLIEGLSQLGYEIEDYESA